jgi:hypothetical protein
MKQTATSSPLLRQMVARAVAMVASDDWTEGQHPRGGDGRFSSAGDETGTGHAPKAGEKQGDLLTSSAEDTIAALFAENARSAKTIGEKLTAAADFAYQESQRGGVDIFGEQIPTASREQVLESLHAHDEQPPGDDLKALLKQAIDGMRIGAAAMDAVLAQADKFKVQQANA